MTSSRRRRAVLAVLGLVLVVGGTAAAWYVAAGARTPGQRAAEAAPPPRSVITAKVTAGELVDSVTLPGVFGRANTVPVRGPATVAAGRPVVTKLPVAVGDSVANGMLIAEVSGRPLLALTGAFPAYRDIGEGDTGPDVAQLQGALKPKYKTPLTGEFDARTAADVRKLYQSARYDPVLVKGEPPPGSTDPPPDKVKVPASEVAFIPELPASVGVLNAKVGDDANTVLLTLASGAWQVVAKLDAGMDQLLGGLPPDARLTLGAGPGQGKPAKLGTVRPTASAPSGGEARTAPPTSTSNAAPPANPPNATASEAVFTVDGEVPGVASGQAQEIVVERKRSPAGTLIVPASALSTRPDGAVEVTVVAGPVRTVVPVEVTMSFQGQAAVRGKLAAGDEVLVG